MAASSVLTVNYRGEALFVNVFVAKNHGYDRMENLYLCVEKNCEYVLSGVFKRKNVKKYLCFLKIRVLSLCVLTCCFIRLRGLEVQEELHI